MNCQRPKFPKTDLTKLLDKPLNHEKPTERSDNAGFIIAHMDQLTD